MFAFLFAQRRTEQRLHIQVSCCPNPTNESCESVKDRYHFSLLPRRANCDRLAPNLQSVTEGPLCTPRDKSWTGVLTDVSLACIYTITVCYLFTTQTIQGLLQLLHSWSAVWELNNLCNMTLALTDSEPSVDLHIKFVFTLHNFSYFIYSTCHAKWGLWNTLTTVFNYYLLYFLDL